MVSTARQFEGWTLQDALIRCVAPELIAARKAVSPIGRVVISYGIEEPTSEERHRNDDARRAKVAAVKANRDLISAFRDTLEAGRLIAFGRRETPLSEPTLIPPGAWPHLEFRNLPRSIIRERTARKTEFLDVRVYPVVRAPNAAELIAGHSLASAFKNFVLGDPEVARLAATAIQTHPEWSRRFVEGHCHPDGQREWAVNWGSFMMEQYDNPTDMGALIIIRDVPEAVMPAERALADRFEALISLLSEGELVARGLPSGSVPSEFVLRTAWAHESFRFNAKTGDLYEDNPDSRTRWDGQIKRWSGLVLEMPIAPTPSDSPRIRRTARSSSTVGKRSREVAKALVEAGIDIDSDLRSLADIAQIISPRLSRPTRTAEELAALAKLLGRLRKELGA